LRDEFNFTPNGSRILFIDEAQESRQLGRFVRFMKEDWHGTTTILTGSMMTRLFHDDIRFPVGRVKTIHVQPFSFFEFLAAAKKNEWLAFLEKGEVGISAPRHERLVTEFDRYLKVGGLPEVLKSHLVGGKYREVLQDIFEQYRRDFVRVYGQEQGPFFEKALQAVADHVGSPSKLTQALPLADKNYKSLSAVFARLEAWHMIYVSTQRGPQPEGTTAFHPKRYLFDLGLLNLLRQSGVPEINVLKTSEPAHRQALGGVFENYAAFVLAFLGVPLSGFKKSAAGMEIDFIAKIAERTVPIECKAALKTKETHLAGLKTHLREYGLGLGVIVNAAPFEIRTYDFGKIVTIPIYALEALPEILAGL
jgi:predicted AAA+ superfamily ATPase